MNKNRKYIIFLIITCITYSLVGITLQHGLDIREPWIYAIAYFVLGIVYRSYEIEKDN